MKFNFKNPFKMNNNNNIDNLTLNDDLDEELLDLDDNIITNKKLKFDNLLKNKKLLLILPIVLIVSGGGYYFYLMQSNDINLVNLKQSMPKIKKITKKIEPKIKNQHNLLKNKKTKINNDDIFNSVMKNSKITNNNKIVTNHKPLKITNNIINHKPLKINNNTINKKNPIIKKESLKIINNKKISDKVVIKELQKDETLLKNQYLPILTSNNSSNKKDVYALTAEELLKLKDMDKYINAKEKYMERVTKFLIKKQKYMTALENFDEFNKEMRNKEKTDSELKLKKELTNKIAQIETLINQKLKTLNNNIKKLKDNENNNINQQKEQLVTTQTETEYKKNINDFFKNGQIFIMNNEYIIAVTHNNGMETIYKEGEKVLDNFNIKNINENMITLEKNHKIYFYNLKNSLGTKEFSKVIIEMPLMVKENTKKSNFNKNEQNKIKKYLTPTERKKLEAKKFFNSNK